MFEVLSIPPVCSPSHFTTRLPRKRSERGSKKREGRIVTIDISLALIVFYEYSLKRLLYKADQLFPQLYPNVSAKQIYMDEATGNQQSFFQSGTAEQSSHSLFSPFGLGPQETLKYRKRFRGMISVTSKVPLKDRSVLSLLYTPGVAAPCLAIAKEPLTSFDYTLRGNTIALVSDGSSAFGFGNIGPMGALPMLEDACILFKTFGGVNAFPICLNTQDIEQSIATGIAIWPTFGGFCLSSIASPRCFTVTDHLARAVNIPVLNADEHATATTILGALSNALKLVGKAKEAVRVVIV